jgi:uncharacterized protein
MRVLLDPSWEKPFLWHERLAVQAATLEREEVQALSAVECEGRLSYVNPGFLLEAELRYQQTLLCDRCLDPHTQSVRSRLELVLMPPSDTPEPAERVLEDGDLDLVRLPGDELDTEPLLLEQLQLNVPMKPLCRNDCPGLCPGCGRRLAEGRCGCAATTGDPRWAALAGLRERLVDEGERRED